MFAFLHMKSILKGLHSKRKEFAAKGIELFPFRVETFRMGGKTILIEFPPPESVSVPA